MTLECITCHAKSDIWMSCPKCKLLIEFSLECCKNKVMWRRNVKETKVGPDWIVTLDYHSTCSKCNKDRSIRDLELECGRCGFEFRP